ncbi:hypothetical protein WBK31_12615 [Nonomuraea sp. N2-4H]|uniref:hypothetical protein n=1 Tax=Nonomuraea sp. N2-4H TaxID=3128898 RepID=UPI0032469A1C
MAKNVVVNANFKQGGEMPQSEIAAGTDALKGTNIINLDMTVREILESDFVDAAESDGEARWYVGGGSGYVVICKSQE